MKRRAFLKYLGAAVFVAAVPVAALAPPRSPWADIIKTMREHQVEPLNGDYYAVVHPEAVRVLCGEMGSYEGIRFIEQTHIPNMAPGSSHYQARSSGLHNTPPHGTKAHSAAGRRAAFYSAGRQRRTVRWA